MTEGIPGPVEEVFGAFAPRFYGVSLILETVAHYKAFASLSDGSVDRGGLGLSDFDWACLRTTLEHENRHFHDSLISPFSNGIMLLRMLAAYNGIRLLKRVGNLGGNCLPVPATKWMYMSADRRHAWMADAVDPDEPGKLNPVPLPILSGIDPSDMVDGLESSSSDDDDSESAREQLARATMGYYEAAAALMRGATDILRPLKLTLDGEAFELDAIAAPRNFFEASALSVQLQAAWTNEDGSAFRPLLQFINSSDMPYARFFRRLARAISLPGAPVKIDPHKISVAAIWCLLGDGTNRSAVDPSIRCMKLLRILDDHGIPDGLPTGSLWDLWDEQLKLASWRSNLRALKARTLSSVEQVYAAEQAVGMSEFSPVLKQYQEDQIIAVDLLLDDPDCYVSPYRYLHEATEQLPNPITSIELGENLIVPLGTVPEGAPVRFPRLYDKDGERGWNRSVTDPAADRRPGLLDAVLEVESVCKISDVVFSNEKLRPIEHEAFQAAVEDYLGVVPMYVF